MTLIAPLEEITEFVGASNVREEKLEPWAEGLSTFIRRYVGRPLETETFTEKLDGTGETTILLSYRPVVAIKAMTIAGAAVDVSGLVVYEHGEVYLADGFPRGRQNVIVTYAAGHGDVVPEDVVLAFLLIMEQAALSGLLKQATRGDYEVIFATDKWPKNAREIIDSYRKKL